jgi:hypothetical protein
MRAKVWIKAMKFIEEMNIINKLITDNLTYLVRGQVQELKIFISMARKLKHLTLTILKAILVNNKSLMLIIHIKHV